MLEAQSVSLTNIKAALEDLGGEAYVSEIKDQVEKNFGGIPPNYLSKYTFRNTIQALININCEQSATFGGKTVFQRIAKGKYELVDFVKVKINEEIDHSGETDEPSVLLYEDATKFRLHKRIERNKKLVKEVKKIQGYVCKVCSINFENKYGVIGKGYIEAHHLRPISTIKGSKIALDPAQDFAVLCANCHRMIHLTACVNDIEKFKASYYLD